MLSGVRKKRAVDVVKTSYKMVEYGAIFTIIDYAKHKKEDGTYDITIFEFQNVSDSQILQRIAGINKEQIKIGRSDILDKLLKKDHISHMYRNHFRCSFSPKLDVSINLLTNAYKNVVTKFGCSPWLSEPINMIYYQLLDYNLLSKFNGDFASKLKPDYTIHSFNKQKVLQRLWLSNNLELQKYSPNKVLIATSHDLQSKKIDTLASTVIKYFGTESELFIKGNRGELGKANKHIKITDEVSLKKVLKRFKKNLNKSNLFCIETASHVGKSIDKKQVSNYRAMSVITKQSDEKNTFNAINLWRTVSKEGNLDSHTHAQTDYFAEQKPVCEVYEDDKITVQPLRSNKADKHLSLEKDKPQLYHQLQEAFVGLTNIDFEKAIESTPVYSLKMPENAGPRTAFASETARNQTIKSINRLFLENENKQYKLEKIINTIKLKQQQLDLNRDWEKISSAATIILQKISSANYGINCGILKELIYEPDAKKAEERAESIISAEVVKPSLGF